MSGEPSTLFWPGAQFAAALASAASRAGLVAPSVEPIDARYCELEARLLDSAPAIVCLGSAAHPEYAVVVGSRGRILSVQAPDLRVHGIDVAMLRSRLCAAIESPLLPEIDRMLAAAGVPPVRHERARRALLRQQLGAHPVEGIVHLRPPPGESLARELQRVGVQRRLAEFLAAHCLQYGLWILSWWIVGRAALEGRFDPGWFAGWALLLASLVPFRLLATWAQGRFAVEAGGAIKRKLLDAALALDPQSVRGEGVGTFVGRVIEAEAVESLALSGGILALTAAIELVVAGLILAFGAGSTSQSFVLLLWIALVIGCGAWCLRRRMAWTEERLHLTHDLVEKMVGHRTRLVQASRETLHAGEDAALERYLDSSRRMDRATTWLLAMAPRGWLLLGILGLGIRNVGGAPAAVELAVELGGVLLAFQALTRLAFGLADLGAAVIAWRQIVPMLTTLSRGKAPTSSATVLAAGSAPTACAEGRPPRVLAAQHLAFTHPGRARPVISGLDLEVFEGDRILLEGPSGSGKSTLASLLTGLRAPDAGVVLLRGIDRQTIGDEVWRHRVAAAPQFHENHVLTESLAFNLLMGRRWPPRATDVQQAEQLCVDLGLGSLLEGMPGGLFEMVGESGWQLSHGERSRLFMARALLQESEIVVLDENFTALDPSTQAAALRCAVARSRTLVVIAHS